MQYRQECDESGETFQGVKGLPSAHGAEMPSFPGVVGDARGRSVLDLASGTGICSGSRGGAELLASAAAPEA